MDSLTVYKQVFFFNDQNKQFKVFFACTQAHAKDDRSQAGAEGQWLVGIYTNA